MPKYQGTGKLTSTDYKAVRWVGQTVGGRAVTLELEKAINLGNIEWTLADKDETVASVTMTAVYSDTNTPETDTTEPWTVEIDGESSGAESIMLGAGVFYIDNKAIGLTRGGGKFMVEREFREMPADGDRGPVEGRIMLDGARASLTMNALHILTNMKDLYPALEEVE